MNEARTLYQLQGLDLEIDALNQELEDIEARIGESEELSSARLLWDDSRQRLHDLQAAQREHEWEAANLSEKIAGEERRLYEGQVRNPKELDSIRREVESLKKSRKTVEDRVLELMGEVEQAEAEVAETEAALERVSDEWEAEQRDLAQRQTQINERIAELRKSRRGVAAKVPAPILASYEDLRRSKRGRAVALVERNTCQGCRISLPMAIIQRARANRDLVQCPSCGRILYAER